MILIFMKTRHWQGKASTTWCTKKLNENQGTPLVRECFAFSLILPIWSEVSSLLSPRRLLIHSFFFFKFNIYFYFELHWIINSCKILQRLAMYPSLEASTTRQSFITMVHVDTIIKSDIDIQAHFKDTTLCIPLNKCQEKDPVFPLLWSLHFKQTHKVNSIVRQGRWTNGKSSRHNWRKTSASKTCVIYLKK